MPYLIRAEFMASQGRAAEYEADQAEQYELLKTQPGFVSAVLLNSLGYPAKYTSLTRWESRESYKGFSNSEAARNVVQAFMPGELAVPSRSVEAYEEVLAVVNEGQQGTYGVLVDWTINPGQANATGFESNRKTFFELRRQHNSDFVGGRLYRFQGNPTRYLVFTRYRTLDGLKDGRRAPEVQEFTRANPTTAYTSALNVLEHYEIMQRLPMVRR